MENKFVPVLVALVIVASFAVGLLYGKVSVYEKGLAGSGGVVGTQNQGAQAGDTQQQPPEITQLTDEQWKQITEGDVPTRGDKKAKVVMVEFTDYECPFCGRYYTDTYTQLVKDYVDTGKVLYLSRDLPLPFHPNAKPGALAARCAGEQNKYFEMHDQLFANQAAWTTGDAKAKFVEYAGSLGLNTNQFTTCYDSGKYNEAIDQDAALATQVGATGTPTFFINGEKIVGAQPYATFKTALDAALQ